MVTRFSALAGGLSFVVAPLAVCAQPQAERMSLVIPPQPLEDSLREIALAYGQSIVAPAETVAGIQAPGLNGRFSAKEAVAALLAGSDLGVSAVGASLVILRSPAAAPGEAPDEDIVVTGTRISGATVSSQTIAMTAEAIRDAGQATIVDAARSLPQNFGGGQNRGLGQNVPSGSGVDIGGGSSFNLRGLGSDATLTLLNGRRLSYSSSRQSVDLSAIPTDIVDRIEIVADGASAIYGSDAVAGVANIILRRDARALTTSARIGAATDGGAFQQIYGASAGHIWQSGGGIVAYEYEDQEAIRSEKRSFGQSRPGVDLFPAIVRHSAAASLHQELGERFSVSIDGLYNHRRSLSVFPLNAAGDLSLSRNENPSRAESFLVAPVASLRLGEDWRIDLAGSYGEDRVDYTSTTFSGSIPTRTVGGCYCNEVRSAELSAEGPLFPLPGGEARLALGAGHRDVGFDNFRGAGNVQTFAVRQRSYHIYGEASLPLLGERSALSWLHSLNASLAARYERYPGVGSVLTPKLGLVASPLDGLIFRSSWGRSFRAPTLLQRYQPLIVAAFPATLFGGSQLPAGSTALYLSGGREDLLPERATSWSVGAVLGPALVPGLRVEVSHFRTDYRDRIVTPIGFITQALSAPLYADQVTLAPDLAAVNAIVAGAGQFLNGTGSSFDPARVAAIVDNASVNAGRQRLHGIDTLLAYARDLAPGSGTLSVSLNASYLYSTQQLTPLQPVTPLAGVLFNPPHFRSRSTLSWSGGGLTLTAAYNHTGGLEDIRSTPARSVDGMDTLDLALRYQTNLPNSLLDGLDVVLSAQNLFNDKPDGIATALPYDTPYDSTNYSPLGRFLAISVSKRW